MKPIARLGYYLAGWFAMLLVAVANGALRDFTYRQLDELTAHQVSTATVIVLLGIVIRVFVALVPPVSGREAIAVGLFWAALTVAFEFVFFGYVGGHSWAELLAAYDVRAGRVWVLLVAWIAVAPYLFWRHRVPG